VRSASGDDGRKLFQCGAQRARIQGPRCNEPVRTLPFWQLTKNRRYITSLKSKGFNYKKQMCSIYCHHARLLFCFQIANTVYAHFTILSTLKNHKIFHRQYVNLTNVLTTIYKHMQCSPDGQPQIIDYVSPLVAEISFLLLHYPSWDTKFWSVCFTTVNDISKIYLCSYVHNNNSEQIICHK
jgi:hypothetical protein